MFSDASAWRDAHQLSANAPMTFPGNDFLETDLVSDGFVPALHTDASLVNPWGVAYAPNGPFWVNDNNKGVVTVYDGNGNKLAVMGHMSINVAPPMGGTPPSAPTGEVFNPFGGFDISANGHTGSSVFLFATEDGTISGWNPGVDSGNSVLAVDNSKADGGLGAVYKGLAIASPQGDNFLFAADFRDGRVDVFNNQFHTVKSFTDPNVPDGYAPFNVANLDHHLFVTFAVRNATGHDDVKGLGHGFVDEFDFRGNLIARVASHGPLDSPWGMAIAPAGFGRFAGDLLVGNFGNGHIDAYDLHTDKLVGVLRDAAGHPIAIDDLWALIPGNHGTGGHPGAIYFTAGVGDEMHGLFGRLTVNHVADLHM